MPYIGNTPADKFLTLAKQNFSTSATTSYTLDSAVSSTQDIALFINNVRQSPVDAYTVSGTALTLTSATAGTDEMYCVYLGKTVGTVSPASDSVTTAMIQSNAVNNAKIADDAVTSSKLSSTAVDNTNTNSTLITAQTAKTTLVDADEFLISDSEASGALKKVDKSDLPFSWKLLKTGSVSSGDAYATLTSVFTSTYTVYKIFIYDVNFSTSSEIRLQWVTGASTVQNGTGSYKYAGTGFNSDGQGSSWSSNSNNMIRMIGEDMIADSTENFVWEGILFNPAGTTLKKTLIMSGGGTRSGPYVFSGQGAAYWSDETPALTGLKISTGSGTFDSMSWKIYGIVG